MLLQDAFDPFADTDEDDEMAAKTEDTTPGTPRPGSPVTDPPEVPLLVIKKSLPWMSKVRCVILPASHFITNCAYLC